MLAEHLVLKGGTAINLLVMPLPRLSVDIDLDFTENCDKPAMLRYRKAISDKLQAYAYASGYRLSPSSKHPFSEHLQFKQSRSTLLPVLKKGVFYDLESVKHEVCNYLEDLMELSDNERLFIERFDNNEYQPELLFEDREIVERVAQHPMAIWKTQDSTSQKK